MTIVAISKKQDQGLFPGAIVVGEVPAPGAISGAGVYVDLDYVNDAERKRALKRLLPAVVIVNAVIQTLDEIGEAFVRLNGWPGFGERGIHELVTPDGVMAERVAGVYERTGGKFRLVPDLPGMIGPRVLAG